MLGAGVQRLAEPARSRGRWIEDLRALKRPACLMVDEIAPTVALGVFESLRNQVWALPGPAWVVSGDIAAGTLHLDALADAFFERAVAAADGRPGPSRKAGWGSLCSFCGPQREATRRASR
ncbi:MAG TPA: hypothetical protein VMA77_06105 [Solirubrobacteraceae bacterium]|nr:hypothetical protein [Solirubrobacteraceae bacterium]